MDVEYDDEGIESDVTYEDFVHDDPWLEVVNDSGEDEPEAAVKEP